MKKLISLILSVLLVMSVFSATGFAAATETKIWHEDFEGENPLSSYTIDKADGSVSIVSTKKEFGGNALKITSGENVTKITKAGPVSWDTDKKNASSVVVSFDFLITDSAAEFYMFGSNTTDVLKYDNRVQRIEYFCRTKYIKESGTYKLMRNAHNETDDKCYIADLQLNVKNNITAVFILGTRTTVDIASGSTVPFYSIDTIYVNGVAYRKGASASNAAGETLGFKDYNMNGIQQSSVSDLRFGAKTMGGTSSVYLDNIKISHYDELTLGYQGESTLNDVNPYNPIILPYDHFIMNKGTVALTDKAGNTVAADAATDGSQLIVTPKEHLDLDSTYTISVSGLQGVAYGSNATLAASDEQITLNTIKNRCSIENTVQKSYGVENVRILIDKDISSDGLSKLSFACSEGAAPTGDIYTENVAGSIYVVIPVTDNLICGMEYTISLANIAGFEVFEDVKFTVEDGINISKPQITGVTSDGNLAVGTITATVTTDTTIPTTSLMLLYYKGTRLIGVGCKTIEPEDSQITASLAITDIADCYVKVYVVDSLDNMKPLTKSTTIGR